MRFTLEVIVSDNGSSDGSSKMVEAEFPQVTLLRNGENLGFSKANNLAIRRSLGRYVLLLNSDTEVHPLAFEVSVQYLDEHPEVGILGGKVLLPDGRLDQACRRHFPNPANAFFRLFGLRKLSDYNITGPVDLEMEVEAVMGAYLIIRRSAMERVGLLDEEFFMYGEDLDWCWRVREAGFKVVYYPRAEILHYKYGTSSSFPLLTTQAAHRAMRTFYRKHYAMHYPSAFNILVYAGIWLRTYFIVVNNLFRKKKRIH